MSMGPRTAFVTAESVFSELTISSSFVFCFKPAWNGLLVLAKDSEGNRFCGNFEFHNRHAEFF